MTRVTCSTINVELRALRQLLASCCHDDRTDRCLSPTTSIMWYRPKQWPCCHVTDRCHRRTLMTGFTIVMRWSQLRCNCDQKQTSPVGWLTTVGLGSENPLAHVEYVYGTVFAFTRYSRVSCCKINEHCAGASITHDKSIAPMLQSANLLH